MADLQDFAGILPSGKWRSPWIDITFLPVPENCLQTHCFPRIHVGLHKGYCKPAAQQTRCPHLQKGELTHVSDRTFSDATSLATVRNCGMFCRTGERVVHVIGFSDGWNPHSILWSYSQCVFPYTFAPRMLGSLEIPWKISTMAWRSITCMKLILHRCFANPTFFLPFHSVSSLPQRNNKDWIGI